jgi:hypothetical protein
VADGGGDQANENTLRQRVCLVTVRRVANKVGGWPQSGEVEEVVDNQQPMARFTSTILAKATETS